jgi:hypothetical protein
MDGKIWLVDDIFSTSGSPTGLAVVLTFDSWWRWSSGSFTVTGFSDLRGMRYKKKKE